MADGNDVPEYKLLLQYDLIPEKQDFFFQYVRTEFVPSVQNLGLPLSSIWHVSYGMGGCALHQMTFTCRDARLAHWVLGNPRWQRLESRLQTYFSRYQRKLVHYEDRFQF